MTKLDILLKDLGVLDQETRNRVLVTLRDLHIHENDPEILNAILTARNLVTVERMERSFAEFSEKIASTERGLYSLKNVVERLETRIGHMKGSSASRTANANVTTNMETPTPNFVDRFADWILRNRIKSLAVFALLAGLVFWDFGDVGGVKVSSVASVSTSTSVATAATPATATPVVQLAPAPAAKPKRFSFAERHCVGDPIPMTEDGRSYLVCKISYDHAKSQGFMRILTNGKAVSAGIDDTVRAKIRILAEMQASSDFSECVDMTTQANQDYYFWICDLGKKS